MLSSRLSFDTGRFLPPLAKRIDSVDPRCVFGGELLFRLYLDGHLRDLRQLLQNRALNQMGNAVSFPYGGSPLTMMCRST